MLLAEMVDGEGLAIVRRFCDAAKLGEPWAVRLAIERLLPRRERRLELELPEAFTTAAGVADAVSRVIAMAGAGELTLEEARAFLALLEQQRKAIETSDLAVRLELLEEKERD